ncbi:hypothetical protein ACT3UJ_06320 [Halomonas sp. 86]|uniref:hypothetical protein n=1 Tax=unclassified Halomonas TaxID=2609666 RepID=UPI00403404AA
MKITVLFGDTTRVVTAHTFKDFVGDEQRLLATFIGYGQTWLIDVATGVVLATSSDKRSRHYSTRKSSGRGRARQLLAKALHENGETEVLSALKRQPIINPV